MGWLIIWKNLILKSLDQIRWHHNLKDQKYLQKNFVKNIIFQQQNLEFLKIKMMQKIFKKKNFPIVIKADNLASGKGVYICNNKKEAQIAIDEIFNGKFGKAKNIT